LEFSDSCGLGYHSDIVAHFNYPQVGFRMVISGKLMDQFLKDFRHTVEESTTRLLQIPADQAAASEPGHWSPKEIVGHLIDSAANNHQRFVRAQFTDDLVLPGYEQDLWVTSQKYNEASWPELVHLWSAYNLHLSHVISVMPEEVLTRVRTEHNLDKIAWKAVPKTSPTTLEYFVRDYAGHMRHHLTQILGENLE
jgi:hypothetical protein